MERNYIYPNNLKEKKVFLALTVGELAISGVLLILFVIYSAQNFSLLPLIIPLTYIVLHIRLLENKSNIWEHGYKLYNYIVGQQQLYKWGNE